MLQLDKTNVIVLPSNNQSFVSDVLNKLNVLNNKYSMFADEFLGILHREGSY